MLRHLLRLSPVLSFASAAQAAAWPKKSSDFPPDPLLHRGVLPNGLRYAILPNGEPRDRVSLRFIVQVGSLHERDNELGLTHFIVSVPAATA